MTEKDTLLENKEKANSEEDKKKEEKPEPKKEEPKIINDSKVLTETETAKPTKEEKKEPPTTIDAIKTDFIQQYRNMAAITLVSFVLIAFG